MEVSTISFRLADVFSEGIYAQDCPTRKALNRVMSRWAPLLLAALSDGEPLRWNQLHRRATGITEKMLAQTLRMLEADGYVRREAKPVVPPHVEYSLTPDGVELTEVLLPLMLFVSTRERSLQQTPTEGESSAPQDGAQDHDAADRSRTLA